MNENCQNKDNLSKDFYDYNKYKITLFDDDISNNYDYKFIKNKNRSQFDIDKRFNINSMNQIYNLKNKYVKLNSKNKKLNSFIHKSNSLDNNFIYKSNNIDNNYIKSFLNNNNKNNYELEINKSYDIKRNSNVYNINTIINNINNNLKNLKALNNRKKNIENILLYEIEKEKKSIENDLDSVNNFIISDNHSYKQLNSKRHQYNYIPNIYKPIENFFEEDTNKAKETKIISKSNINLIDNQNNKSIFGFFYMQKINAFEDLKEFDFFKFLKLTNPLIIDNNNNLTKLNSKVKLEKKQGVKLLEFNDLIKNSVNIDNNSIFSTIDDNKKLVNNNYSEFYENNLKKEEKIVSIESYSQIQNEKKIDSNIEKKYLMDKIMPIQRKYLTKQNSFLYELSLNKIKPVKNKSLTRQNSFFYEINKKINNNINKLKNNFKNKKKRFSHSIFLKNMTKNSNNYIYSKKNSNIIDNNKNNNINIDTYKFKNKKVTKENIDKNKIFKWLKDLNILKKEDENITLVSQYACDGILLCDIINSFENNKIDGVFRTISSKKEALINISKALDYLKKLENFPKRHVFDNELIFEIDEQVIWELLYDLYKYYRNKMGYIKIENEKNEILNKINNNNLFKFNIDSLLKNNKKYINVKKNIFFNKQNSYKNEDIIKTNKIIIDQNNYEDYNNQNNKTENSSLLSNSYNYYNNKLFNKNKKYDKNKNKNYYYLKKIKSIVEQKKLSDEIDEFDNNKKFKNGYFDYVNNLKNYFDKNKITQKTMKNDSHQIKKNDIYQYFKKNNQTSVNHNNKLHFNYNNISSYNNKNKNCESPIKPKYNNIIEYYKENNNNDIEKNNTFESSKYS